MRLEAAKQNFAQSKCIILDALHKLLKKRARKTAVVQADSKVTFHTVMSLVWAQSLCLACQHLIQIGLITKCVKPANQKHWHMPLLLCGIRTRHFALINALIRRPNRPAEGLERLRRRQVTSVNVTIFWLRLDETFQYLNWASVNKRLLVLTRYP